MQEDPGARADPGPLLPTGEFSRRTGLSLKALRIYDELGLLKPATVHPGSGRRGYAPDQIRAARLIGMLRGAGLSLTGIGPLLADLADRDQQSAVTRLDEYLAGLEQTHTSRRLLIAHLKAIVREQEEDLVMFPIQTRHVPARRVMSIQRRLRAPQTDAFARETRAAFAAHLSNTNAEPAGPFMLIFHGIVDHESDGPLEAALGCPPGTEPTDLIGIRTEPAHDEAFTPITKAQWDFPAILAVYDAVACSPEVTGRPRSELSCREVYVVDPATIGRDEIVCEIAYPLG